MPTAADIENFIREHLDDDPHRLLLSAHRYPGYPLPRIVRQIEALRKIREKVPSWHHPALQFPFALSVEQASSEQAARYKAGLFSGKKMADLTGGMGIDSFFWAKQFEQVTYIEQNTELYEATKYNFGVLDVKNVLFQNTLAEDFLTNNKEHFDLIYLDPARRDTQQKKVFLLEDCQPNVVALRDLLLETAPKILVKTAPLLDLKLGLRQLGKVSKIWVISLANECKEVLYLLEDTQIDNDDIPVCAVSLNHPETHFSFTYREEQSAEVAFSAPLNYLYEPDAAVLKAGAFKVFAARFGLAKLHPNTHLFTSEHLQDVPLCRIFRIENTCKYDKKAIKALVPEGKANIAARNFPDSVAEVRKKTGLGDGGDCYLFAVTTLAGKCEILVAKKANNG